MNRDRFYRFPKTLPNKIIAGGAAPLYDDGTLINSDYNGSACISIGGTAFQSEYYSTGYEFSSCVFGLGWFGPTGGMYQSPGGPTSETEPVYVGFIFNRTCVINRVAWASNYAPSSRYVQQFYVEGSNNTVTGLDGTWTRLTYKTAPDDWMNGFPKMFSFTNTTAYKAYRLKIVKSMTYMDISFFKFIETSAIISPL